MIPGADCKPKALPVGFGKFVTGTDPALVSTMLVVVPISTELTLMMLSVSPP